MQETPGILLFLNSGHSECVLQGNHCSCVSLYMPKIT